MHQILGSEDQVVVQGNTLTLLRTLAKERRYELGIRGVRSVRVAATLGHRVTTSHPQLEFTGLRLDAVFSGSYRRVKDVNRGVVTPLNSLFGLGLRPVLYQATRARRGVLVGRMLHEEDLEDLAAWGTVGRVCPPPDILLGVQAAAQRSGVECRDLIHFLTRLRIAEGHEHRALLTQGFVRRKGLRGFAAMHALLGGHREDLLLMGNSETYAQVISKAAALQLKLSAPGAVCSGNDLGAMIRKLDGTLASLQEDNLIDTLERRKLETHIAATRQDLLQLQAGAASA